MLVIFPIIGKLHNNDKNRLADLCTGVQYQLGYLMDGRPAGFVAIKIRQIIHLNHDENGLYVGIFAYCLENLIYLRIVRLMIPLWLCGCGMFV